MSIMLMTMITAAFDIRHCIISTMLLLWMDNREVVERRTWNEDFAVATASI